MRWIMLLLLLFVGSASAQDFEMFSVEVVQAQEVVQDPPAAVTPSADTPAPAEAVQGANQTSTEGTSTQVLIATLASALVALFVGLFKAVPFLKKMVGDAGTFGNRALPIFCLMLGVLFAVLNAWWLHTPLRSAAGWDLVQQGIQIGLGAIGVRGVYRSTIRGQ